MTFKQPRSIQVVIFAEANDGRRYLLLKRISEYGGFWQSVTGSLEEAETNRQAAVREVFEETGFNVNDDDLIDLGLTNNFEISPRWRAKYAPSVTHNEEVCFALRVSQDSVRIDPTEHDAYAWLTLEEAVARLYWDSNRRALAAASLL